MTVTLYHFTCEHAAAGIIADAGILRPNPQPSLGGLALVWATPIKQPQRESLGLTSRTLTCDRMAHRFELVTDDTMRHWFYWRHRLPINLARRLEASEGARPGLWYASTEPQRVIVT